MAEYFSPAVQLGLTATPKRKDNVDTYRYFSEPVYTYSLKEGINDGFLTPFKVKRIKTTLDDYIYTSDDDIIEGDIEEGKLYTEPDFNRIIEIKEREAKRVQIFMDEINQNKKSIVFCATQNHAAAVRDLVNQNKKSKDPNYYIRVTANDGEIGEQFLSKSFWKICFENCLIFSKMKRSYEKFGVIHKQGKHYLKNWMKQVLAKRN
ncbi:MAG: hypothetical protein L3J44_00675 [Campylobacteraceae bacterium]|nr:hypothetical protein [Campylobacteraceae bacterium]